MMDTKWHEIEDKKPTVNGTYLVTVETTEGELVVAAAEYENENGKDFWEICSCMCAVHGGKIIAWAEMPKPYRGKR